MVPTSDTFSEGETVALFLGVAFGLFPILRWGQSVFVHGTFGTAKWQRLPLFLVVPLGLAALEFVLINFADSAVRNNPAYHWLFLLLALGWLNAARYMSAFLGVSLSADVVERNNPAAIAALTGVFAAVMIGYGGGNIGNGATISTTLVSALLAFMGIFAAWFFLELAGKPSAAISEDRDLASGIRLAGFLTAIGLIFGAAMSGDWVSMEETVSDLWRRGWPTIVILAVSIVLENKLGPTRKAPHQPVLTHGILPLLFFIMLAAVGIFLARS